MTSLQRRIYGAVIRLHPASFRDQFGRDMARDFDDALEQRGFTPLLGDAIFSLARQWKSRALNGPEPDPALAPELAQLAAGHPFLAGQYLAIDRGTPLNAFDLATASVLSILLVLTIGFAASVPNRHVIADTQSARVSHDGGIDTGHNSTPLATDQARREWSGADPLPTAAGLGVGPQHGPGHLVHGIAPPGFGPRAVGGPPALPITLVHALIQLAIISTIIWITSFFLIRSPGVIRRFALATLGLLGLAASVAFGQAPPPPTHAGAASPVEITGVKIPAFAVVSVKQNKSGTGFFRSGNSAEGISVENASLLMIIRGAYGMFNSLDDKFIGVPDWAKTEKYDIEAKVDPADLEILHKLNQNQRNLMLQGLLVDRFKLKMHQETREQPIYALVVAKNGPKLKAAKPGDTYPNGLKDPYDGQTGAGVVVRSKHRLAGQAISMSSLAVILTQIVGRTVVDKTGLAGAYDFTLNWTPEIAAAGSPITNSATPPPEDSGPSIFTAIQELLGLRLEPIKGPVEIIVVDRIERPPEN
jgi:uncharacterized protein (TIGR03435 family)